MITGPLFSYFGAKWSLAPHYPAPTHRTIVEPFAGSACYALRYPDRDVVLVERDEHVAAIWRFLLRVSPAEVLALPDIGHDQCTDDLAVPEEARLLIGFWINAGCTHPNRRPSKWMRIYSQSGGLFWGARVRERIARAVPLIRHWRIVEGSYVNLPRTAATWFVDPPYQVAGKRYRHRAIDYPALGEWCRSLPGQVIVCENIGASWLPFRPFRSVDSIASRWRGGRRNIEGVWLSVDGRAVHRPVEQLPLIADGAA